MIHGWDDKAQPGAQRRRTFEIIYQQQRLDGDAKAPGDGGKGFAIVYAVSKRRQCWFWGGHRLMQRDGWGWSWRAEECIEAGRGEAGMAEASMGKGKRCPCCQDDQKCGDQIHIGSASRTLSPQRGTPRCTEALCAPPRWYPLNDICCF